MKSRLKATWRRADGGLAQRRREVIAQWRSTIANFDYERERFGGTYEYSQLKVHGLDPRVVKMLETPRTIHIGADGELAYEAALLQEVDRIEKQWGLS